jgi:hypothetical protein
MLPAIQPSQHAVQVPQLLRDAASCVRDAASGERDAASGAPFCKPRAAVATGWSAITLPQHFLYFLPLPQGQGSFRGTLTGP